MQSRTARLQEPEPANRTEEKTEPSNLRVRFLPCAKQKTPQVNLLSSEKPADSPHHRAAKRRRKGLANDFQDAHGPSQLQPPLPQQFEAPQAPQQRALKWGLCPVHACALFPHLHTADTSRNWGHVLLRCRHWHQYNADGSRRCWHAVGLANEQQENLPPSIKRWQMEIQQDIRMASVCKRLRKLPDGTVFQVTGGTCSPDGWWKTAKTVVKDTNRTLPAAMRRRIRLAQWRTWVRGRDRWDAAAEVVQELFMH